MQHQQLQHQQHIGKPMSTLYQPSESDFSFDLCGADKQQQRTNVQRSISQPECANENERSLLKYNVRFSFRFFKVNRYFFGHL